MPLSLTGVTPPQHSTPDRPAPSREETCLLRRGQQRRRLLLEIETGRHPLGSFSWRARDLTVPSRQSRPSGFAYRTGRKASPTVTFSPTEYGLNRGEQVPVHVAAVVDEALVADVRYLAEISVPGLSDSRVPIDVRRRMGRAAAREGADTSTKDLG